MKTHQTQHQLAINFDQSKAQFNRTVRTQEVQPSKAVFHAESSSIESTSFSLKFSLRNRSFMVTGSYHATAVKNQFRDETLSREVDFVHIEKILTYRAGFYVHIPVLKNEELYILHATKETLKNPYFNPFLTLRYEREVHA